MVKLRAAIIYRTCPSRLNMYEHMRHSGRAGGDKIVFLEQFLVTYDRALMKITRAGIVVVGRR